jgi:putative ABC transport system permease protein
VRADGDPRALATAIRAAVRSLDPARPVFGMRPLDAVVDATLDQPRLNATALSALAVAALALASLGLYGLLMLLVSQRRHELGVRMALGAPRRHVLGLMLTMGGRLVAVGLAIGVAASLASTRLLRSQLFGVQSADPIAYAAVAVLLGLVALVACYIPARRAAGVDPMVALRQE